MKEYSNYMDNIQVSAELHEKIMQRVAQKPQLRLLSMAATRYVALTACAAVLVVCILTVPGLLRAPTDGLHDIPDDSTAIYKPNGERLPGDYMLSLEQARNDADFGGYLPISVPAQFAFKSAQRSVDPGGDSLSIIWDAADGSESSIYWTIIASAKSELDHIVSVRELEKYDMSLYPDPWEDSVPETLLEYFKNPIFQIEELTLDTVSARVFRLAGDVDEERSLRMAFSVLYDDILVRVDSSGATPEQLFEMLTKSIAE